MSEGEGEVRSTDKSVVLGEERWVYFLGERTARVMCVFGREEMEVCTARPSSPAPRRRIRIGCVVMLEVVEVNEV